MSVRIELAEGEPIADALRRFRKLNLAKGAFPLYRLEERGQLGFIHKRPQHSAASASIALQRAVEPRLQHVEQVHQEYHRAEEDEAGGCGEEEPTNG